MEATSNESSSSPSSESSPRRAQSSTAVPKKKRVRRQQLELKYLRELSGELERRLEQLKKQRLCSPQTAQCRSSSEGGGVSNCSSTNLTGKIKYGPVSVWEAIADHQLNERSRAEKSNKKLRLLLRKQSSMIQSLQARAQKVFGNEELTMMQLRGEGPRYWDLGSENEEIVFADLLVLVARTRLEIQKRQLEDPRSVLSFATWGVSLGKPYVRAHSEAGLVMETHACSLVPFNVTTTAAAYWRMFSLSPAKHEIAPDDAQSSDVFVRSFTCSSNHFGENIDERGKHTCRRYVEENGCVTIVFAGRTGPTKSAAYQDVQLQRTGWIKVRQLRTQDSDQPSSAVVEMHSETQPRFRHDSTRQAQRAREIVERASKLHHMTNDWYRQTLSEVLVEEDWKAFRGTEAAI